MLLNVPYENYLSRLNDEQFANEIRRSVDYERELDYLMGVPNIYILAQFVKTRSRMSMDDNFLPENIELYNELLRRSRRYAESLPIGSLERRSFYASANEVDMRTPIQNRVVRGAPQTPRQDRSRENPNPNNRGVRRNLMEELDRDAW